VLIVIVHFRSSFNIFLNSRGIRRKLVGCFIAGGKHYAQRPHYQTYSHNISSFHGCPSFMSDFVRLSIV